MTDRFGLFYGLLVIFGFTLLWVEATSFGLYHEEPTRVLVAVAMLSDGAWIVPDLLGDLYLKKPPGFNWWIALFSLPFGQVTVLTARLSVIGSWLGLGAAVGYFADFSEDWAFGWYEALASLFCLTIYVEKAALAELDLFFTLTLFLALASWHWLRETRGATTSWLISHGFLALALLVKGPVAYVFYYLPIGVYLVWTKSELDWKGFLGGFVLGHLPLIGWLYLVVQQVSFTPFLELVVNELFNRGSSGKPFEYAINLLKFPLVSYFSFLPWCFVFLAFGFRELRQKFFGELTEKRKLVLSAITPFLVFWFFPVNSIRYLLPVFPWLALLSGDLLRLFQDDELFLIVLRRVGYFLGGLLCLLIVSPWVFDSTELISFRQQLVVAALIAVTGFVILVRLYLQQPDVREIVLLFVTVLIVLKFGYLTLFVPSDEPHRFVHRNQMSRVGQVLRSRGFNRVHFASEHNLEVPYYFLKQGLSVRKTATVPSQQNTALVTTSNRNVPEGLSLFRKFELHDDFNLYAWTGSSGGTGNRHDS